MNNDIVSDLCEWIGYLVTTIQELENELSTLKGTTFQQPELPTMITDSLINALGESADKNALAIAVAQHIVRNEIDAGIQIAQCAHRLDAIQQKNETLAQKLAEFHVESQMFEDAIEAEIDKAKNSQYLDTALSYF